MERTTGDYAGVGLLVDSRNGWVTVVAPMPAHRPSVPASARATCSSRWMARVAADWTSTARCRRMRGKIGTPIELAVRRDSAAEADSVSAWSASESTSVPCRPASCSPRASVTSAVDGAGELRSRELEQEIDRLMSAGDARPPGARPAVRSRRAPRRGGAGWPICSSTAGQEILVSRGRAPGDNHRWSRRRGRSGGVGFRSWSWSTAAPRAPRRSSPARCRTTIGPWWWATRPTARGSCRPCFRSGPTSPCG